MDIKHKIVHPWHDVSPGDNIPHEMTAFIDVPKGSTLKYELDKDTGFIRLDRVLYSAVHYPGDYGFIPQTISEDGDPTDVIVITNFPIQAGTLVDVRPVGILEMIDDGERDEKIICVPTAKIDPRFAEQKDIGDFSEHVILEIKHFFETYKLLQGKEVTINGMGSASEAKKAIQEAIANYTQQADQLRK